MPYVTNAQIGDSVNADFLRSLGVGNYDVCIVTIGSSFQDSLETTCLLKELGAKWVVSGQNGMYRKNSCCGTERIRLFIRKNRWQNGQQFVTARIMCLTILKLTVSMRFFEVEIPENWIGKNVGQLDIRKKYGINILATRKYGKTDVAVSPETVLDGDATILVLGEYKAIQKCFRI